MTNHATGDAMTDRYVIVYRDGKQSALISKDLADNALPGLMSHSLVSKRPAYRIRVREKVCATLDSGGIADVYGDGTPNALPVPAKKWLRGPENIDYVFP